MSQVKPLVVGCISERALNRMTMFRCAFAFSFLIPLHTPATKSAVPFLKSNGFLIMLLSESDLICLYSRKLSASLVRYNESWEVFLVSAISIYS